MFGIGDFVVAGYDLSNEYAQISYCENGETPGKTISLMKGQEQYNIPVCLFKRSEVNQWFVGQDAVNFSALEEGEMIWRLWERALIGEPVTIGEENFDPIALLALYVKRSLVLFFEEIKKERLKGIMFTVPELTMRALEVMEEISSSIDLGNIPIGLQGREESIYYYVIYQDSALWNNDVLVYDFNRNNLLSYRFHVNKLTKPKVAFVNGKSYEVSGLSGELLDERFEEIVKENTEGHIIGLAYLLGGGFDGDWAKTSLKELCRNRRAFKGNNLYSRGACYSMLEKIAKKSVGNNMIFLGKDKLRSNIGLNVIKKGEENYLALLDGGESWFESKKSVDLIIDEGNSFVITLTPLDGRNIRNVEIVLDGLNEREKRATRIKLDVVMESADMLRINVTDLGFGEFFPASDRLFTKQIALNDNEVIKDE